MPIDPASLAALRKAHPQAGEILAGGPVEIVENRRRAAAKQEPASAKARVAARKQGPPQGDWMATENGLYLIEERARVTNVAWNEVESIRAGSGVVTARVVVSTRTGRVISLRMGRAAARKLQRLTESRLSPARDGA